MWLSRTLRCFHYCPHTYSVHGARAAPIEVPVNALLTSQTCEWKQHEGESEWKADNHREKKGDLGNGYKEAEVEKKGLDRNVKMSWLERRCTRRYNIGRLKWLRSYFMNTRRSRVCELNAFKISKTVKMMDIANRWTVFWWSRCWREKSSKIVGWL